MTHNQKTDALSSLANLKTASRAIAVMAGVAMRRLEAGDPASALEALAEMHADDLDLRQMLSMAQSDLAVAAGVEVQP